MMQLKRYNLYCTNMTINTLQRSYFVTMLGPLLPPPLHIVRASNAWGQMKHNMSHHSTWVVLVHSCWLYFDYVIVIKFSVSTQRKLNRHT